MLRLHLPAVAVLASASACSNLVVIRGSTNDFLKKKATTITLNVPLKQVQTQLDELFDRRGFKPTSNVAGEKGSQVIIYQGPRREHRDAALFGVQLGSWFAARLATDAQGATEVWLMGKPMVSNVELCSDHDKLLEDIQYACFDTKVPPDWAGKNMVSGRDETEVVSDVLSKLYERMRQ